ARRARSLADAGAAVAVVSPALCAPLATMVADGIVTWVHEREYRSGDLDGAWLAHAATGDRDVDALVAQDAESAQIFCVVAGDAVIGTAWVPAIAHVDDVV